MMSSRCITPALGDRQSGPPLRGEGRRPLYRDSDFETCCQAAVPRRTAVASALFGLPRKIANIEVQREVNIFGWRRLSRTDISLHKLVPRDPDIVGISNVNYCYFYFYVYGSTSSVPENQDIFKIVS